MSTNTVMSCGWQNAQALVTDIKDNELNATKLVAQCAGICDIAFETKRNVFIPPETLSRIR